MKVSSAMLFAVLVASAAAADITSTNNNNARQLKKGDKDSGRGDEYTSGSGSCEDPAGAVLDLLNCVATEDGACAASAYDPDFQRFHNEVFTGEIAGQ